MNLEIRWMWSFSTLKVFLNPHNQLSLWDLCYTQLQNALFRTARRSCLTDNSRRLPGSARAVSRTRDRNCSSTTDNCRRRAAAATDALRAYCCTAEHRYYPPSHEKADNAHGVRATDRRGNTARSCGRRGKPESTISRRLSQGNTKIYFPRDFQLGRSSKPPILWPTEGTTGSECFLGRSCVRIRRLFLRETKTRTSMVF